MSYRFRPVRLFRTGYRWWLDRAEYVVSAVAAGIDEYLLMETGDFLLLEDGSKIILE